MSHHIVLKHFKVTVNNLMTSGLLINFSYDVTGDKPWWKLSKKECFLLRNAIVIKDYTIN